MDPQDIINALQTQRNNALDALAVCIAEGAKLARDLKAAQDEIKKLKEPVTADSDKERDNSDEEPDEV